MTYALTGEQEWEFGIAPRGSYAYRTVTYRLDDFDEQRLGSWLEATVAAHDALRAVLDRDGERLTQKFSAEASVECPVLTVAEDASPEMVTLALAGQLTAEVSGASVPAVSVAAARQGRAGGLFSIGYHRALVDDISFARLRDAFIHEYPAGVVPANEAGPYEEYVRRATARARSDRVRTNTDWWIRQTAEADIPHLPDGNAVGRPADGFQEIKHAPFLMPPTSLIRRAATRRDATVPALLLAASAGALATQIGVRRLPVLVPATPGRIKTHKTAVGNFVLPMYLTLDLGGELHEDVEAAGNAMLQGLLRTPCSFFSWAEAYRKQVAEMDVPALVTAFLYEEHGTGQSGPDREPVPRPHQPVEIVPETRPSAVPPNYLEFRYVQEPDRLTGTICFALESFQPAFIEALRDDVLRRIATLLRG